jgi:putative ABC transport system permease protein
MRPNSDFSDEIQAHIRLEADRLVENGMGEEEALKAAMRAFGNIMQAEEKFYDSRRWIGLDSLRLDLRLAIRLLWKTPGWTAVAVLTVALGIGATAAIFSIVNTVLLRSLPFSHPEQLYAVVESTKFGDEGLAPDYFTMRENLHGKLGSSIVDMAAFDNSGVNWTNSDHAERLVAGNVTASFFPTLGVQPILGRVFLPEEDRPGADKAVILSYRLWRQRFNGDSSIIGQRIRLDREAVLVVGVMPATFDFQSADLWRPFALDEAQQRQRKAMRIVNMIARVDAHASPLLVHQELDAIMAVAKREYPVQTPKSKGYPGSFVDALHVSSKPLQEQLTGKLRPALLVFSGSVGLMLLIVCFTVANLMLARATARQREIAVRVALGSPRMRIVSQMLTESLIVSLTGGVVGLGLAWEAVAIVNGTRIRALTGLPGVSIDSSTSLFTLAVTVLTGLLFGMAPSLGSLGFGVRDALKRDGRGATASSGARRARQALVVGQLGLSLTLLIGAGLLSKSFYRLRNMNPGFNSENVLTARINLTGLRYDQQLPAQREFMEKLLEGVGRLPGVEHVAIGGLPPLLSGNSMTFRVKGKPPVERGQEPRTFIVPISAHYFQVMQTRLVEGRLLSDRDNAGAPLALLANEAFARRFFPGESAIGRRISTQEPEAGNGWAEIVGIVGDIRQSGFDQEVVPTLYRTYQQEDHPSFGRTNLLVRTSGDPRLLTASIEKTVSSIDRDLPMFDAKTMEQRMSDSLGTRRFNAALTGAFALAAMFLASIGVYGVMSYMVTLRTSEVGIRLALGARRGQVLGSVLREGAMLALFGAVLGIGGALALGHYLESLLYGVGTRDAGTFAVAVGTLCGAVMAACAIPGRRAAAVDPATALRCD